MRVLVTGGAGFIGSHLTDALVDRGDEVLVVDDLSTGERAYVNPSAAFEELDIRTPEAAALVQSWRPDAICHLAAQMSVSRSVREPLFDAGVNLSGALNVLEAARAVGARFVFASTGGALIGDAAPPVDESSVPRPISPYGASKLAGEGYCHAFRGSYGLETIALRFANVYGPGSDLKRGAVTTFIKRALAGEPLTIYGDGGATRDFIYVDDLCAGILAALDRRDVQGVVHLASERETTIEELARLVLAAAGADAPIEHVARRRGEVERNFAVARLAGEVLGWRAGMTLEDGLAARSRGFAGSADR